MIRWFKISNEAELRASYRTLKLLKAEGHGKSEEARSIKEEIREYYKCQEAMSRYGRIVKDYGIDGYIFLQELPKTVKSVDDAYDYFEDHLKVEYRDRGYDCTGQRFTSWYKICERRGRFYVYHRVACDV